MQTEPQPTLTDLNRKLESLLRKNQADKDRAVKQCNQRLDELQLQVNELSLQLNILLTRLETR